MPGKHNFKPARLIKPDPSSKDQRWMIKFYAWDEQKQKVVMFRDRDINKYKDLKEREWQAELQVKKYNLALSQGAVWDSEKLKKQEEEKTAQALAATKETQKSRIGLFEAIDKVIARKSVKSDQTIRDYNAVRRLLLKWLGEKGMEAMLLKDFDLEKAREFLHGIVAKGNSNRYHNNLRNYLKTIFGELEADGYPAKNYFAKIAKLPELKGRNLAYDRDQQLEVLKIAEAGLPALAGVIKTIYYTLMRESELLRLQVEDIFATGPNEIYLPASKAKNKVERYIQIPPELMKVFEAMDVKRFPPKYYVFSNNSLLPGPKKYTVTMLGRRYLEHVLKKVNYGPDYTLYSWKHTGVVEAKLAEMGDAFIIMQGGWQDVNSYNKYLKSLAILENTEFSEKMPTIGQGKAVKGKRKSTGPF